MFYYIPIEPLEERYTEQWYRWFPEELKKQGVDFRIIIGETLTNTIKVGKFLDINSTLYYKSDQLRKIAYLFHHGQIKPGDVFFVADIEFWGIEAIRYLSDLNNIPVKLYGFCHAASYTTEDYFSKCERYGKHFENGWFEAFDKIFVGSNYHRDKIIEQRRCDPDKIFVSGNPYDSREVLIKVLRPPKENQIICTNRPDYEKRPNLTLDVFTVLKEQFPEYKFVVCTSREKWGSGWIREKALYLQKTGVIEIKEGLNKAEYFTELARSYIMTGNSIEENFGYCILEAMILGCAPVVENKYSHPEVVHLSFNKEQFLFDSIEEQIGQIGYLIKCREEEEWKFNFSGAYEKYDDALSQIIKTCTT